MNKFNRQSKKLFVYNGIIALKELVISYPLYRVLVSLFKNQNIVFLFIATYLALRLYYLSVEYFSLQYKINSNNLTIKQGIINQREFLFSHVNKNNIISNVRDRSDIIQRVLHITELEIFLVNNDGITIRFRALNNRESKVIKEWIQYTTGDQSLKKTNVAIPNLTIHSVPIKIIFLTSFLSANYLAVIPFLLDFNKWTQNTESYLKFIPTKYILFVEICLIAILFLIGLIIVQYFNFGKFRIKPKNDKLYISNGFINEDDNIIDISSIKGVVKHANIGMRLLGLETVSVLSINDHQGSESKSKNYILPYINKKNSNQKINYLIRWNLNEKHLWLKRKRYSMILCSIPKTISLFIIAYIIFYLEKTFHNFTYMFLIIFFAIALYIFKSLFTYIKFDNDYIYVKQGILTQNTFIIPYDNVENLYTIKNKFLHYDQFSIFIKTVPSKKFEIIGSEIPNAIYKKILN